MKTLLPSGGESCLEYPAGNIAYPQYCMDFACAILHIGGSPILCIITVSPFGMNTVTLSFHRAGHSLMQGARTANRSHSWNKHLFELFVHKETYPIRLCCRPKVALYQLSIQIFLA